MAVKKNSTSKVSPGNGRAKTGSRPTAKQPARKAASAPADVAARRPEGPTIVGIAGSAGALSSLQTFFDALPAKTGMAFVVVTHLSPEHESHMASLLQPHTKMSVVQVNRRMPVRANHVYVIPPSRNILITDSHVDVVAFNEPRSKRMPIDFFFRTLARSHSDAVAIILSGGGTDGSVGVKEVKQEGGLLLVQDPEEAEYSSMPNAAIATGLVDVVLPAQDLASKLMQYARHVPVLPIDGDRMDEGQWSVVQAILAQVQRRTKHDFSQYKRSTILRRIRRRMLLNTQLTLDEYLEYMRAHPPESFALLNDLLIGVTNFFRDSDAWEALAKEALPVIFDRKDIADPIRVWSVGCASGEEAYSLAILLMEAASTRDENRTIQIFASDIDDDALARSREGLYPAAIEADVSPERLERFFVRRGDHYQVRRDLRDMILFTPHSVLRDPPFSHQDLIVCRNLLIYLQRDIQQYVMDVFHYALNSGGYLFLGNSEAVAGKEAFFQTVDKNHRIFQATAWRAEQLPVPSLPIAIQHPDRNRIPAIPRPMVPRLPSEPAVLEEQHRHSLESFGPPSVLVSGDYGILHLSETAGRFLLPPKGPITSDLIKLARPELQSELRSILFQAFDKGRSVVAPPVILDFDGQLRQVVLAAYPRKGPTESGQAAERQALVMFMEDELHSVAEAGPEAPAEGQAKARITQLQAETQRLRDQLQTTTEEYESSTEEMKAANEELQSINEEYHLTTEELETSKEELEAVNEELQTVNNELKGKLEEISRAAHKDLENVMGAMEIATLFLDRELRIQRYTPALGQFFNVLRTDVGRPIGHLSHMLGDYGTLSEDAQKVLDSLTVLDREVQGPEGKWYLIRLRPYRTTDNRIEGVVITFVDVTKIKEADVALRELNETLEARVEERTRELQDTSRQIEQTGIMFSTLFHANPIPTSLTRLDDGLFLDVNEAYAHFFALSREDIQGRKSAELGLPFLGQQRTDLVRRLRAEGSVRNLELEMKDGSGERRTTLASLQRVTLDGGDAILATFIDITDRVRAEQQVRTLAANLTAAEQKARHRISQILHDDLQQRLFSIKVQLSFLRQAVQEGRTDAVQADEEALDNALKEAIETTRRLSIDLSPAILQGSSLADALAWLKDDVRERYGMDVGVEVQGTLPDVPEHLRVLLFNTLRELLFNVVKHSDVLQARIQVEPADRGLKITLSDHGKGFDAESIMANAKAAHGLLELRNRLSLLGGTMQVRSHPGDGTTVLIGMPL